MSTMCYIFHTHFSIVNCLVEESQRGGIWFLVPFPRGRREEPNPIPDHAVPQARPAQLRHYDGHQQQVQEEQGATPDQLNTTFGRRLYLLSVHLYCCYDDVIVCLH